MYCNVLLLKVIQKREVNFHKPGIYYVHGYCCWTMLFFPPVEHPGWKKFNVKSGLDILLQMCHWNAHNIQCTPPPQNLALLQTIIHWIKLEVNQNTAFKQLIQHNSKELLMMVNILLEMTMKMTRLCCSRLTGKPANASKNTSVFAVYWLTGVLQDNYRHSLCNKYLTYCSTITIL